MEGGAQMGPIVIYVYGKKTVVNGKYFLPQYVYV